jgi:peptidyl-prolyl cis-trans isomerase C
MRVKLAGLVVAVGIAAGAYFALTQNGAAKETPPAGADGTVVATVNGDKIFKKEVTDLMKNLPKEVEADKVYPMIINQMVSQKLLDKAVEDAKVEQDKDFQQRLAETKEQMARDYYLGKIVSSEVTDATVKSEYEKFKAANEGKQEVHARQILVSTEAEAKQVIADLGKGAKFEDLATKRSSGPSAQNGGDVGYFLEEEMVPEFSKAAFALKPGEYTKTPVQTQFGWHVIKVEDKRARTVPKFEDVEAAIRNKLGQQAVGKIVQDLRAKADVKLFDLNGKPLETPAAPPVQAN